MFEIRKIKKINPLEIEKAFVGKKAVLTQLQEEAKERGKNIKNLIREYDNIKIDCNENKIIEKWTD